MWECPNCHMPNQDSVVVCGRCHWPRRPTAPQQPAALAALSKADELTWSALNRAGLARFSRKSLGPIAHRRCTSCSGTIGGAVAWCRLSANTFTGVGIDAADAVFGWSREIGLNGKAESPSSPGRPNRVIEALLHDPLLTGKFASVDLNHGAWRIWVRSPKPYCQACALGWIVEQDSRARQVKAWLSWLPAFTNDCDPNPAVALLGETKFPLIDGFPRSRMQFDCSGCGALSDVGDAYPALVSLLQIVGLTVERWRALPDGKALIPADLQRMGYQYEQAAELLNRLRMTELLGSGGRIENHKLLAPCARCVARILSSCQQQVSQLSRQQVLVVQNPNEILDNMSGDEFERTIAKVLQAMGWTADLIGGSGDHGADIFAKDQNGKKWVVQAKKRISGTVPYSALQEINTARHLYGADFGAVVSQAPFSAQTIRDAKQLGINLWGRDWVFEGLVRVGLS